MVSASRYCSMAAGPRPGLDAASRRVPSSARGRAGSGRTPCSGTDGKPRQLDLTVAASASAIELLVVPKSIPMAINDE